MKSATIRFKAFCTYGMLSLGRALPKQRVSGTSEDEDGIRLACSFRDVSDDRSGCGGDLSGVSSVVSCAAASSKRCAFSADFSLLPECLCASADNSSINLRTLAHKMVCWSKKESLLLHAGSRLVAGRILRQKQRLASCGEQPHTETNHNNSADCWIGSNRFGIVSLLDTYYNHEVVSCHGRHRPCGILRLVPHGSEPPSLAALAIPRRHNRSCHQRPPSSGRRRPRLARPATGRPVHLRRIFLWTSSESARGHDLPLLCEWRLVSALFCRRQWAILLDDKGLDASVDICSDRILQHET